MLAPFIGWNSGAPPPSYYSFNMTAADIAGGVFQGYLKATGGSIDAEPVTGHDLYYCIYTSGVNIIALVGDCTGLMAGLHLYVDGVDYGLGALGDWVFSSGYTLLEFVSDSGPVFVPTVSYFIEFKP